MHTLDGFKKFLHKGGTFRIPKVVIRKNGQIGFNAGAVKKYDLDVFEFVLLYISKEKKDRIAIKFTNNEKESGLISVQKRKGNYAFSARSFLKLYDFDYSKTINYDFDWIEKEKTAIFKPNKRSENAI